MSLPVGTTERSGDKRLYIIRRDLTCEISFNFSAKFSFGENKPFLSFSRCYQNSLRSKHRCESGIPCHFSHPFMPSHISVLSEVPFCLLVHFLSVVPPSSAPVACATKSQMSLASAGVRGELADSHDCRHCLSPSSQGFSGKEIKTCHDVNHSSGGWEGLFAIFQINLYWEAERVADFWPFFLEFKGFAQYNGDGKFSSTYLEWLSNLFLSQNRVSGYQCYTVIGSSTKTRQKREPGVHLGPHPTNWQADEVSLPPAGAGARVLIERNLRPYSSCDHVWLEVLSSPEKGFKGELMCIFVQLAV